MAVGRGRCPVGVLPAGHVRETKPSWEPRNPAFPSVCLDLLRGLQNIPHRGARLPRGPRTVQRASSAGQSRRGSGGAAGGSPVLGLVVSRYGVPGTAALAHGGGQSATSLVQWGSGFLCFGAWQVLGTLPKNHTSPSLTPPQRSPLRKICTQAERQTSAGCELGRGGGRVSRAWARACIGLTQFAAAWPAGFWKLASVAVRRRARAPSGQLSPWGRTAQAVLTRLQATLIQNGDDFRYHVLN